MTKKLLVTFFVVSIGFALISISSSIKVEAASCSWVGGNGTNWSNPANWDGGCSGTGGIPADGDIINFDSNGVVGLSNNNISNLDLVDINIYGNYTLTGNDILISNSIFCSDNTNSIQINTLINNASVTFLNCNFENIIDLNGNNLNLEPSISHWEFYGFIQGTGSIITSVGSWIDLLGGASNDLRVLSINTSTVSVDGGGWDSTDVILSNGGYFYGTGGNVASINANQNSNIIQASYGGVYPIVPNTMNVGSFALGTNDQIRTGIDTALSYDQIIASGSVDITDATFYLFPNNNFVGTIGDTFTILTAGSLTGTFHDLPDGAIINSNMAARYQIHYTATEITLEIVSGYCTWNGNIDSNWSNTANWDPGCSGPGGIPAHGDRLTFDSTFSESIRETTNDLGEINLYGIDFLAPFFSISGDQLDMFKPISATNQADIYSNVWMRTPTMGDNNYFGTLEVDDQVGTITFNMTRDMIVAGSFDGCYPSMHIIFDGNHDVTMSGDNSQNYCMDVAKQGGGTLFVDGNYPNMNFIVRGSSRIQGSGSVQNLRVQNGIVFPQDQSGNPTIFHIIGNLTFADPLSMARFDIFGNTPGGSSGFSQIVVGGDITGLDNAQPPTIGTLANLTSTDVIPLITFDGTRSGEFAVFGEGYIFNIGANMQFHYAPHELGFRGQDINLSNTVFSSNPTYPVPDTDFVITTTWTGNGGTPTGIVYLYDGATLIGTANLTTLSSGTASFTITGGLTAGVHNLTVQYEGNLAYDAAISSALAMDVGGVAAVDPGTLPQTGINIPLQLIILSLLFSVFGLVLTKRKSS